MDLLIRNAELPHSCGECPFGLYGDLNVCSETVLMSESPEEIDKCPIVVGKVVSKTRDDDSNLHLEFVTKETWKI